MQEIIDMLTATIARQKEEISTYKELVAFKNRKLKRLEYEIKNLNEDVELATKLYERRGY